MSLSFDDLEVGLRQDRNYFETTCTRLDRLKASFKLGNKLEQGGEKISVLLIVDQPIHVGSNKGKKNATPVPISRPPVITSFNCKKPCIRCVMRERFWILRVIDIGSNQTICIPVQPLENSSWILRFYIPILKSSLPTRNYSP